jgi:hypothetical protein
MVFTLVFPTEADYVLRRLKIEQVLYQPEAAGDYHL